MCAYYPPEAGGLPPAPTANSPVAGRLVRGNELTSCNGKQVSLLGTLVQLQGTVASVRSVDGVEVSCTLACAPTAALQSAVIICGEAQGNSLVNCFRVVPLGGDIDNETADKVLSLMQHPALADLYTAPSMPPPP
ncbi:hypothetical protein, conserved [Eimeria acervulina]|uniref:Replication factor A protein 3 domain-containing protein n=1 Tax=Eimeria acervulina TaxID=5801 RepID=U6GY52_EIMAC|nr:hypothetical protein, conserved [Eimeria acervulina]CDI84507.1 hypothetical protein, conserved [Eimeria acervulina]